MLEHVYRGRTFRQVGTEPYTRLDGSETQLIVWQAPCVACGAPFTVRTPVAYDTTQAFGRARCDVHKQRRST